MFSVVQYPGFVATPLHHHLFKERGREGWRPGQRVYMEASYTGGGGVLLYNTTLLFSNSALLPGRSCGLPT